MRSSAGSSPARPTETRSATAICAETSSRSWPATGTPSPLRERITSSKAGPRLRTRMRMSPGRQSRPVASPSRVQVFTAAATRRATRSAGTPGSTVSTGAVQALTSSVTSGSAMSQSSTAPGALGRALAWTVLRTASSDSPSLCASMAKTASTAFSTIVVEREGQRQRHVGEGDAGRLGFGDPGAAGDREFARVGTLEAVDRLFGSPTAKRVRPASRAPAPAANSWVRVRRISIAAGWCPAPRPRGRGRCRGRACTAPSRRRLARAGRGHGGSGRRSRGRRGAPSAPRPGGGSRPPG